MAQFRRFCLFCGGAPLSEEHIWSDWLDALLPRGNGTRHSAERRSNRAQEVVNGMPAYASSRTSDIKQGAVHGKRTKTICRTCNGGWMSGIVDRAKGPATRAITLTNTEFSIDDQRDLATWLVLSAYMRDRVARVHDHKVSDEVRNHLYRTRTAPTDVYVGIGAIHGARTVNEGYFVRVCRQRRATGYPVVASMHSVSVSMGGLIAVIVFSWRSPPAFLQLLPAVFGDCLTRIWPPVGRPVSFPNYNRRVLRGQFIVGDLGTVQEVSERADRVFAAIYQDAIGPPKAQ